MNKVMLRGNVGKDGGVLFKKQDGNHAVRFSLAVNGDSGKKVDWFTCFCHGLVGKEARDLNLTKGDWVEIEGSLATIKRDNKLVALADGRVVKDSKGDIVINVVKIAVLKKK